MSGLESLGRRGGDVGGKPPIVACDGRTRDELLGRTRQCRRLAEASLDDKTRAALLLMTAEYEAKAGTLDSLH